MWSWLFEDLNRLGNLSAIGAFIVTFAGAGVGIWGYCRYRLEFRKKRRALESYLKEEKRKAQGAGKAGQRSLLNVIRYVGLTEDEILRISFVSKRIRRKITTDEEGFANQLLLEYVGDK